MIDCGKGYFIKMDSYNFILCKEKKISEEQIVLEELTYHSTLRNVLKALSKHITRGIKEPKDFKELTNVLKEIEELIENKEDISVARLREEYFEYRKSLDEKMAKRK